MRYIDKNGVMFRTCLAIKKGACYASALTVMCPSTRVMGVDYVHENWYYVGVELRAAAVVQLGYGILMP